MSINGIIRNDLYKRYKAWVFLKDWVLMFVIFTLFLFSAAVLTYLGGSFVDWNWESWSQFKTNGWWYFRLCSMVSLVISFGLEIYLFKDSYEMTKKDLGE